MNKERMYNELIELITTDSASGKETAIAEKVAEKLREIGFTVERDQAGETFPGGSCGNIWAYRDGELDGSILLSSHLDRVPLGLGIKPVVQDGVMVSDGTTILAADDVSGLCIIMEACRQVIEQKIPMPRIEILFTVAEEIGLFGAKAFDITKSKSKIAYIFDVGGPAGKLVIGTPGMYRLTADIIGKAAHAGACPENGINAAKVMCDIISGLEQGRIDSETTSNFPILSTGSTSANVVCDHATIKGEARSRSKEKLENYVAYFKNRCEEVAAAAGATVTVTAECLFEPSFVGPEEECRQIAEEAMNRLGYPQESVMGGGANDGNVYNAKGIVSLAVACGYYDNHTLKESLKLDEYYKTADAAVEILKIYAEKC